MYGNNIPATICEQVASTAPPSVMSPEREPISIGELAQAVDSILGESLSLADGSLRFMSGQDSLPMEKMGEPGCLRDSLLRCHTQARQLHDVLQLIRKFLG